MLQNANLVSRIELLNLQKGQKHFYSKMKHLFFLAILLPFATSIHPEYDPYLDSKGPFSLGSTYHGSIASQYQSQGLLGAHQGAAANDQCELYKVGFLQDLYFQYVQYKIDLPSLKEFTLCMWSKYTNHSNDHPLFSYAGKQIFHKHTSVNFYNRHIKFQIINRFRPQQYFILKSNLLNYKYIHICHHKSVTSTRRNMRKNRYIHRKVIKIGNWCIFPSDRIPIDWWIIFCWNYEFQQTRLRKCFDPISWLSLINN